MNKLARSYRFIATVLALLILISSVGFSVNMHFCMGELVSVSLFGEAEPCAMAASEPSCHASDTAKISKMDCCQDSSFSVKSEAEAATSYTVEIPRSALTSLVLLPFLPLDFLLPTTSILTDYPYLAYKPPLLSQDVPVLVQSLLI
ncbi:HYC_CC_PP family protein [Tunicatimonas pelagia]|uniref:HYC_CC_PP family protein n=1 Tax=Tunicatimonas pelagia TaxID=931531 RepID=UPI002665D446|nr:hypothetical protein [Tunicatimonas pelagia]WKN44801.1 hypothetical protein P0M28_07460 [Tunicatimonas pelagia]